jgi:hypothetical protein
MAKNRDDLGKGSEHLVERDAPDAKPTTETKRQSGRPPARPPYDQYLRVSKVVK